MHHKWVDLKCIDLNIACGQPVRSTLMEEGNDLSASKKNNVTTNRKNFCNNNSKLLLRFQGLRH